MCRFRYPRLGISTQWVGVLSTCGTRRPFGGKIMLFYFRVYDNHIFHSISHISLRKSLRKFDWFCKIQHCHQSISLIWIWFLCMKMRIEWVTFLYYFLLTADVAWNVPHECTPSWKYLPHVPAQYWCPFTRCLHQLMAWMATLFRTAGCHWSKLIRPQLS